MILGVGVDLVDVPGFAEQLADRASTFVEQTFSDRERAYADQAPSREPERHLAARYAAKEAALKAMDAACARAGIQPPRVALGEIEVLRDGRGRPSLGLSGAAAALATALGVDRVHLSLSHDGRSAIAMVVLERLGADAP
ncbi:MAG: holo-ACP synthase [Alphaproteobacteria bacterium]|nr:holo-ACP synthase [Alphaproteobacteria bacterium]